MYNKNSLSQNDKVVMEVIWTKGEASNAEVLDELNGQKGFTRDTVKTYIRRLREKALVGVNQLSPKRQKYYPLITKEEYLANEASEYLHNNYEDLAHMVAGLVENEKISQDEIASLEKYIKELKAKEGK